MADRTAAGDHPPPVTSTAWDWFVIYLKGVFMGSADTVPGVSGGTIALITGIYERLVTAIAAVDLKLVGETVGVGREGSRLRLREAAERADLLFLIVLGLGIFTAIITVSRLVAFGLADFRAPTNAFFFGLIAASAIVLYEEVRIDTPIRLLAAVLAAGFAFLITGVSATGAVPHGLPIILVTGAVTSSAMLLPGISGAALMYVLGQYEYMIGALHRFLDALLEVIGGADPSTAVSNGTVVATFLFGVGIGLVTIAHAVRWALSRDRATTLTVLVSLMVGALRLPAAEILAHTARWTLQATIGVFLAGVVGAALVLLLNRYTDDLDYDV